MSPNFVTGILGGIALILAFIGLREPAAQRRAGCCSSVFGVVLFALELTVTSHGLLAIGGIVCFALGASALYTDPGDPFEPLVRVATPVVVTTTVTAAVLIALIAYGAIRSRGMTAPVGRGRLGVGAADPVLAGVVRRPLEPDRLDLRGGEEWTARSADDRPIERGTPVKVVSVDGLTVLVERRSTAVTGLRAIGEAWNSAIAAIAAGVFIIVVILVIVYLSIRVVQQYEKMVVFRLGRTNESMVRDPGLRFLIPIIDRPVKVDIREQFIEVPSQTTITGTTPRSTSTSSSTGGSATRSRASSTSTTSRAPSRAWRRRPCEP